MLKRPTSRRKSKGEQIELNLVPMLDTMVTLIGFLLFTMSFLNLASIESPVPMAATENIQEQLKERPLQLTVSVHENDVEVWSPFEKIESKTIPNTPEKLPDMKALHEALIAIKQQFPTENKVVLVPTAQTNYDTLVALMDQIRVLEPTDPTIMIKNPTTQVDEPAKGLFPEIVFGNLLSDS